MNFGLHRVWEESNSTYRQVERSSTRGLGYPTHPLCLYIRLVSSIFGAIFQRVRLSATKPLHQKAL
jgi:hypothetical protein